MLTALAAFRDMPTDLLRAVIGYDEMASRHDICDEANGLDKWRPVNHVSSFVIHPINNAYRTNILRVFSGMSGIAFSN